jgi:hypothetical protein
VAQVGHLQVALEQQEIVVVRVAAQALIPALAADRLGQI